MDNDISFENLANAIIVQAVIDYSRVLNAMAKHPCDQYTQDCYKELESFFHSEYFQILSNIDPDYLIEQTTKSTYNEIRQRKRSYAQSTATLGAPKRWGEINGYEKC